MNAGGSRRAHARWNGMLAAARWLRAYSPAWFRADLVAGVTLAAYLLPSGIGDASLAQLPPEAGLYACLFSGLVFWLFCSSRQTAITVTSAISLLVGSSLGEIAGGDVGRFGALASCTALLAAALAFIAWFARAGAIVNFISETVLIGFKAGVALHLASTQLPKLCGIKAGHGDFWERMADFLAHADQINIPSLALGGAALAALVAGRIWLRNKPVSLFVVVGGIATASFVDFGGLGVKLLGEVPSGLPPLGLPAVSLEEVRELLPLALACFLLGAVETAAIGRMFAEKHGYRLDSNQEFLALAGANMAAGLGQGFPVSGGMSQSLVNEGGGARTPISGLVAAGIVLMVVVFFSETLRNLPQPVLAAIVIFAVVGLFKAKELLRLWRLHRDEFLVAMAALLGVLGAGLLRGVLIGAVISLVLLIRRASVPNVAFLGRIPGTRRYTDAERHASNEPIPGVLAFRPESGLVYFNADHVFDTVLARVDAATPRPKLVVGDLSNAPFVDIAGARMLLGLGAELKRRGIALRLADARSSVRDMLRIEGVEKEFGRLDRSTTLADVIEAFDRGAGASVDAAREAAGPPHAAPGGTAAPASSDKPEADAPTGVPPS
ncbi:MAG: STAS domain-containing protein [Verrucomicrobiae bacterium]|nr:STAS domain-containing protein [Verrucomicrobiae bacterium]